MQTDIFHNQYCLREFDGKYSKQNESNPITDAQLWHAFVG